MSEPLDAHAQPAVVVLIKTIVAQETAQDAHTQWNSVIDAQHERVSKLAELMDEACEDVLAYLAFLKEHWRQIASRQSARTPQRRSQTLLQCCRPLPQ